MDALILALAEQGHWLLATILLAAGWAIERRFSAKLRAHDEKNDEDFRRLDDKIDSLRNEVHEIGKNVARIDGRLNGRKEE